MDGISDNERDHRPFKLLSEENEVEIKVEGDGELPTIIRDVHVKPHFQILETTGLTHRHRAKHA